MSDDVPAAGRDRAAVVVREAGAADLDAMAALDQVSSASPWGVRGFESELERAISRALVAVPETVSDAVAGVGAGAAESQPIRGFAVFWVVADEAELLNIAACPERRRGGIGTTLLEEVLRRATDAGAAVIRLEVRSRNVAARALYERAGFSVELVRRSYYGDDDALVMVRRLRVSPL